MSITAGKKETRKEETSEPPTMGGVRKVVRGGWQFYTSGEEKLNRIKCNLSKKSTTIGRSRFKGVLAGRTKFKALINGTEARPGMSPVVGLAGCRGPIKYSPRARGGAEKKKSL